MNRVSTVATTFEGVYVPIVTPFRADESIDEAAYAAAVEFLLDAGVAGIVVGGTTGEYYAMSMDERLEQLELGSKLVAGRAHLIAGCNSGATRDVIRYAQFARGHDYDAIMLAPPPASLPRQAELAAHVRAAIDEAGLPVVLYNYPARSGVEFGIESLDLLADVPEVIALKESSGDFSRFLELTRRYDGRIQIMCGSDDQAFDYFMWGVRSWLSGPANGLPRQSVAFVEAMLSGERDLAQRQFATIWPWIHELEQGSFIQKVKATMSHVGPDVGVVRRPMIDLDDDERAALLAVVDSVVTEFDLVTSG